MALEKNDNGGYGDGDGDDAMGDKCGRERERFEMVRIGSTRRLVRKRTILQAFHTFVFLFAFIIFFYVK